MNHLSAQIIHIKYQAFFLKSKALSPVCRLLQFKGKHPCGDVKSCEIDTVD